MLIQALPKPVGAVGVIKQVLVLGADTTTIGGIVIPIFYDENRPKPIPFDRLKVLLGEHARVEPLTQQAYRIFDAAFINGSFQRIICTDNSVPSVARDQTARLWQVRPKLLDPLRDRLIIGIGERRGHNRRGGGWRGMGGRGVLLCACGAGKP